jgi:hypothetical protein
MGLRESQNRQFHHRLNLPESVIGRTPPTERQRIGDQVNAAMIFAWAQFHKRALARFHLEAFPTLK